MSLANLKWNDRGLVSAVAQDAETGEIRMVAFANREAIERTLQTRVAHFFSRSRDSLWKKGESSGNTLTVREIWVDCDRDTVLYLVDPAGPSCHTGAETCFYTRLDDPIRKIGATVADAVPGPVADTGSVAAAATAAPTLLKLERTLRARVSSTSEKSYTKSLLDAGADRIGDKLREEAEELSEAIADEGETEIAAEAGDVTYHMLVGLLFREIPFRRVLRALSSRFGQSGRDEKRSR